jgi:glutathione S-transferase
VIRLHDNLSSGNGYKVRLLLAQLAIPFERIEYDIDGGETRTLRFLEKVNPNGRVPVLQTENERFLPESNAILCYLAEGTPFVSDDRFGRAQVLRWMFFEQYSHEPNIATPRYWITHGLEMTEERRARLEPKRRLGYAALGVMEGHLMERATSNKWRASALFSSSVDTAAYPPPCQPAFFSERSATTSIMPPGGVRRTYRKLIHRSA